MSKTAKWVIGIVIGFGVLFVISFFLMFFWALSSAEKEETVSGSGERVAIVELKETIIFSEEIVRQLKKYRENNSIRAIVLRIESPGGGVAATQEIYEEVKKTRNSGKPVIVSMGSVAASGAYYVSCGATRIVANPGTLTGSIGVIMQFINFDKLMKMIGVDETTVKTGKYKDSGSPFRKLTNEEKKYFSDLINDVHNQFVDVVATERNVNREQVLKYADGRVFTGKQALKLGLIDTLGTLEDAINIAAEIGGIKGKPSIVKERKKKNMLDILFGEEAKTSFKYLFDYLLAEPSLQYKFEFQN